MCRFAVNCSILWGIIISAEEEKLRRVIQQGGYDLGFRNWLLSRTAHESSPYLAEVYADIARWDDIYSGGGEWRYTRRGGMKEGSRRVASLGAARALCAELARLCFTEGTQICGTDTETEKFIRRVLDENRFYERFPEFIQRVFALGGGAVKTYWDNGVKLDFVQADCFVPTAWDSGGITGGAFASRVTSKGKSFILAETQELYNGRLTVENKLYDENGGEYRLNDVISGLSERSVINGISKPLFVYFRACSGGYRSCMPLGASVFAGAEDTLKSIDLVFDSLGREFILGKKRIIVPYYAVRGEYDENGDIRKYFDVNDEVFQAMSVSDSEELKITDNTAELRITEHIDALSALLDLLCMQVGLSEGSLSYKDGSIRTATEVVSHNSRTYRTQAYFRALISEALSQVMENICVLGKMAGQLSDSASESASVMFADGAAEDDASRTERALKLYNAGLISKSRAISQVYGITLEEAKAMERNDQNE